MKLEDAEKVAVLLLAENPLVAHQLNSFNHYSMVDIEQIVLECNPVIVPTERIMFTNVSITSDILMDEAIRSHKTLCGIVRVDMCQETLATGTKTVYRNLELFRFPLMLGSRLMLLSKVCTERYQAGTFIVNGIEKCLVSQETVKPNYVMVWTNLKSLKAEIRSSHPMKIRSSSTLYIHLKSRKDNLGPKMSVTIPFLKKNKLPLWACFRLLGVESTVDMHIMCSAPKWLTDRQRHLFDLQLFKELRGNEPKMSNTSVVAWIKNITGFVQANVQTPMEFSFMTEFLPHCPSNKKKSKFLGHAICKMLLVHEGLIEGDQQDSYINKRINTPGILMSLLTRQLMRAFMKNLRMQLTKASATKSFLNIPDYCSSKITQGLSFAFATGVWGTSKGVDNNQFGVVQILDDSTKTSRLSQLRIINTQINREGKNLLVRQLHSSHYRILCSVETPEGRTTGLIKSPAFLTKITCVPLSTMNIVSLLIISLINMYNKKERVEGDGKVKIFVNGVPYLCQGKTEEVLKMFRSLRTNMTIPSECVIYYNSFLCCVHIDYMNGTLLFPVVLKPFIPSGSVSWTQLAIEGKVMMLSKEEEPYIQFSDIHPSFSLFGIAAGCIPFSNKNQGPRNLFAAAMSKQTTRSIPIDFPYRIEKDLKILCSPQKPLVTTSTHRLCLLDEEPNGQVCTVAFLPFEGRNQEDSIIIGKSAIERGMFNYTVVRSFREVESNFGTDTEKFELHTEDKDDKDDKDDKGGTVVIGRLVDGDYSCIDPSSGIIRKGSIVRMGTVILSKMVRYTKISNSIDGSTTSRIICKDASICWTFDEAGTIDDVAITRTSNGHRAVVIRVISLRIPEVGDKFFAFGQKGVIGAVVSQEDLPFTQEGITPDIIFNPHCLPSRMTLGLVRSAFHGRIICTKGKKGKMWDATAFEDCDWTDTPSKVPMFSGKTGVLLKRHVFMGLTKVCQLKHFVKDKIHARATGPIQVLTRQPVHGRKKDGGFRFGSMEKNAVITHGATSVLHNRFITNSDGFKTVVCTICGHIAEPAAPRSQINCNLLHRKNYCRLCRSHDNIVDVMIPYATKLLIQELAACHIRLKLSF
jgi:DNA-directed RNA polymerase II subunit RPB2